MSYALMGHASLITLLSLLVQRNTADFPACRQAGMRYISPLDRYKAKIGIEKHHFIDHFVPSIMKAGMSYLCCAPNADRVIK
jgi:hypothetical protein